jgi:hypothetical protein
MRERQRAELTYPPATELRGSRTGPPAARVRQSPLPFTAVPADEVLTGMQKA